jgi:hypothetical protein
MNRPDRIWRAGRRAAYEVAEHIDRGAMPILVMHDVDGHRIDRAQLSPAHTDLLKRIAFINRPPYEGGSWHQHFAYGYLLADPGLYCSLIVTNQTAYAIYNTCPIRTVAGVIVVWRGMGRNVDDRNAWRQRSGREQDTGEASRRRLETVWRRQVFRQQRWTV